MKASQQTALQRAGVLDAELEQQRAFLRVLEDNLIEREAELTALADAIATFERRYHEVLGARYGHLADLAVELSELREPPGRDKDPKAAGDSAADPGGEGDGSPDERKRRPGEQGRGRPAESARRLFRRLARRIHPDLARSAEERERRTLLMMAANRAYEQGDVERLRELLEDWEQGPDAVIGTGPEADLERLVRRIEQARKRLAAIGTELGELEASHMGSLYLQAVEAEKHGFDLLTDMAAELDKVISRTEDELREAELYEAEPAQLPG
jgi:hypothetical protein